MNKVETISGVVIGVGLISAAIGLGMLGYAFNHIDLNFSYAYKISSFILGWGGLAMAGVGTLLRGGYICLYGHEKKDFAPILYSDLPAEFRPLFL